MAWWCRKPGNKWRKKRKREHYPAPYAILELWKKYDGDPFAAANDPSCSIESLFAHPTTANLIRIFFLQERLKSVAKGVQFAPRHVHVVGAGVMGGDIAAICAMRGLRVTLQDTAPERLAPAVKRAAELFKRRLRDPRRERDALDRLIPDVSGSGARHADVLIEAIFENLEAKRSLFAKLESMAKPDAILATNTSSLKLADISTALKDPSRLVGIHFFNPVPLLQLVEIVSSERTNAEFAKKAAAFVRHIDKLPLPAKDSPGFLVNRVLGPYMLNAFRLLDQGQKPETLDRAMEDFGMPMGPAELADTVGLDICLAAGKALAKGATSVPEVLANKVQLGQLGKKTGQGIYRWVDGKAVKGQPDAYDQQLVDALIEPYLREAEAVLRRGHRRRRGPGRRRADLRHRLRAVPRRAAALPEKSWKSFLREKSRRCASCRCRRTPTRTATSSAAGSWRRSTSPAARWPGAPRAAASPRWR